MQPPWLVRALHQEVAYAQASRICSRSPEKSKPQFALTCMAESGCDFPAFATFHVHFGHAQDREVVNLSRWQAEHCPKQAVVIKLGQLREEGKKKGVTDPLPIVDMKEFLPNWSKKVHGAFFHLGSCFVAGSCLHRSVMPGAMASPKAHPQSLRWCSWPRHCRQQSRRIVATAGQRAWTCYVGLRQARISALATLLPTCGSSRHPLSISGIACALAVWPVSSCSIFSVVLRVLCGSAGGRREGCEREAPQIQFGSALS